MGPLNNIFILIAQHNRLWTLALLRTQVSSIRFKSLISQSDPSLLLERVAINLLLLAA